MAPILGCNNRESTTLLNGDTGNIFQSSSWSPNFCCFIASFWGLNCCDPQFWPNSINELIPAEPLTAILFSLLLSHTFLQGVCLFRKHFSLCLSVKVYILRVFFTRGHIERNSESLKHSLCLSPSFLWNLFKATRRALKQMKNAVCRRRVAWRTSNENRWHNYELGCVCVCVFVVFSSHHSIRLLFLSLSLSLPLSVRVRCLSAN